MSAAADILHTAIWTVLNLLKADAKTNKRFSRYGFRNTEVSCPRPFCFLEDTKIKACKIV